VKISQQLKSAAIGILVIGSSSLVSVYLNSLGNDSKVVNSAGIVRGGTQRLVKLELAGQPSDKLIDKQDKLVRALVYGDPTLELPAATDPEFIDRMKLVATAWSDLKQKIVNVRQNSQAKADLLAASERYFELANDAVFAAETYSTNKTTRLRTLQLGIFAASLILLVLIWMTVNKTSKILADSTDEISTAADRIAQLVKTQEKSISHQAMAVNTTTQIMGGLQDLSKQSIVTVELSVERVDLTTDLLKKLNATTQKQAVDIASLLEKIDTISTHINLLDKQSKKIAKTAIPSARSGLTAATIDRQSGRQMTIDNSNANNSEIDKLVANLQSSIAAMMMVANDSSKILEIDLDAVNQANVDIDRAIATIDYLVLNNKQVFTTANQYHSAIKQVMTLMTQLNVGAQETATTISQVGTSARQLGGTTAALQTKI
jgi:methyl-accepting chemotaxis protein